MTRILCLGDSITDCGRLFSTDPLGKGYVKQLSCLLHNTDHRFSIENRGIDGFTLERLLQNTDFWLESSDPDIVTVLIGINDVGIMMNTRRSSAQQQDLMNKFVTRYELLAKKLSCTNSRKRKLYFLEPFVFPWPRCYASWAATGTEFTKHSLPNPQQKKSPRGLSTEGVSSSSQYIRMTRSLSTKQSASVVLLSTVIQI